VLPEFVALHTGMHTRYPGMRTWPGLGRTGTGLQRFEADRAMGHKFFKLNLSMSLSMSLGFHFGTVCAYAIPCIQLYAYSAILTQGTQLYAYHGTGYNIAYVDRYAYAYNTIVHCTGGTLQAPDTTASEENCREKEKDCTSAPYNVLIVPRVLLL
jgi:hypothetical protein